MFTVKYENNNAYLTLSDKFDLPHTLDCGQAFRWEENDGVWHGVAYNKYLELKKCDDGTVIFYNTTEADFRNIWQHYFDLDRNYNEIIDIISENETLRDATRYAEGIRILNQEPWETLCSFIISQNNNIKRIKGIINRLCENFGEDMGGWYTFPSPEKIASLTLEDLAVLRSGFRAKYILDAAQKVRSNTVVLEELKKMPTDDARLELMKITGVGPKVADCTLLFSLEHTEAFPKDVWIKRAMQTLFGGELPECALPYAGIAQQYIFFYARDTKID